MIFPMQNWSENENTALYQIKGSDKSPSQVTYTQLADLVAERMKWLQSLNTDAIALAMDNSIEWVAFDLACFQTGICCIPLPAYFSVQQINHILEQSQVGIVVQSHQQQYSAATNIVETPFSGIYLQSLTSTTKLQAPKTTGKITFTSGSTGSPKGVCLSNKQQLTVAQSIVDAVEIDNPVFLSLLPLPTLLENVAGVYGTLLAGGKVILSGETERGFQGSRLVNPENMLSLISLYQPTAVNLVPELLLVLVGACQQGWQPPASLSFIAVGGSKVDAHLLKAAHMFGLPVYQGYGLSECASVVALNTPQNENPLSAGKVLPHNQVSIEDGELVITGNTFLGYLGDPNSWYPQNVKTGDIAKLTFQSGSDYLFIEGRRKNILINSFGRNISPEWPESILIASGAFRQAFVFGDGKPALIALVSPVKVSLTATELEQVIHSINLQLPDYAQIKHVLTLPAPLTPESGLVTDNFRPRRQAIYQHYEPRINSFYSATHRHQIQEPGV